MIEVRSLGVEAMFPWEREEQKKKNVGWKASPAPTRLQKEAERRGVVKAKTKIPSALVVEQIPKQVIEDRFHRALAKPAIKSLIAETGQQFGHRFPNHYGPEDFEQASMMSLLQTCQRKDPDEDFGAFERDFINTKFRDIYPNMIRPLKTRMRDISREVSRMDLEAAMSMAWRHEWDLYDERKEPGYKAKKEAFKRIAELDEWLGLAPEGSAAKAWVRRQRENSIHVSVHYAMERTPISPEDTISEKRLLERLKERVASTDNQRLLAIFMSYAYQGMEKCTLVKDWEAERDTNARSPIPDRIRARALGMHLRTFVKHKRQLHKILAEELTQLRKFDSVESPPL